MQLVKSRCAIVAAALLSILSLLGMAPPAHAETALPLATVSGHVTDHRTGAPLGGVTITDLLTTGDGPTAITDPAGAYTLAVSPGEHRFRATADGFTTQVYETLDPSGNRTEVLTLADGDSRDDVNFALDASGTVGGLVTAADGGAPVPGVRVRFFLAEGTDPTPVDVVVTDDSGAYLIANLPAGRYRIQFDASQTDFMSRWWPAASTRDEAEPVVVAPGDIVTGKGTTLVLGAKITGTIRDERGAAVSGAQVCPQGTYGGNPGCTYSESDGTYALRGLFAGQYTLVVTHSGFVPTYFGNSTEAQDFFSVAESAHVSGKDVVLPDGASVSGTIADDQGNPLRGVQICTYSWSYGSWRCAYTSGTGTYSLEHLWPGWHYFQVRLSGYNSTTVSRELQLTDQLTGVDATLTFATAEPVGSISGVVSASDGQNALVQVDVHSLEGYAIASTVSWAGQPYTIENVPEGTYRVFVSGDGYQSRFFMDASGSEEVTVVAGQETTGIDVTLEAQAPPGTGTVRGRVVDAEGAAITGASVATCVNECHWVTTDSDGSFILATDEGYNWISIDADGFRSYSTGRSLEADEDLNLGDVTLERVSRVSGTVTAREDGRPLAGVEVRAMVNDGYGYSSATYTDENGRFEIGDLRPGPVSLIASTEDNSRPNVYLGDVSHEINARYVLVKGGQTLGGLDLSLPRWGSISGTVSDRAGDPQKASVCAASTDAESWQCVTSGSDGGFTIGGMAPGAYVVSATTDPSGELAQSWWRQAAYESEAERITLDSGEAASGLSLDVLTIAQQTATLAGRVTLPDGQPAAGFYVTLASIDEGNYEQVTTASDGSYRFTELAPSSYLLSASGPWVEAGTSYGQVWWPKVVWSQHAEAIAIEATESLVRDLQYPVTTTVSGHVLSPSGLPLAEASVTLSTSLGEVEDRETDASGAYVMAGIPAEDYTLKAQAAGYLPVRASIAVSDGQPLEEHDFTLQAGATIGGTVASGDGPVESASVMLINQATGAASGTTRTAVDGQYALAGVAPGTYLVLAWASGNFEPAWHGGAVRTQAIPVTVAGVDVITSIDIDLPQQSGGGGSEGPGYALSGHITLPEAIDPAGLETGDIVVTACGEDDCWRVDVDSTLDYAFAELPSDTYQLEVRNTVGALTVKQRFDLVGASVRDITLAMGAILKGRLVDATGREVSGAVEITANGTTVVETYDWTGSRFEFNGLPSGHVSVTALAGSSHFVPVTVEADLVAGEVTQLPDLVLTLAGRVTGRILHFEGDGDCLAVTVTDLEGRPLGEDDCTYPGNAYSIGGLAPGEVLVKFDVPGQPTRWWRDADSIATATTVTITAGEAASDISPSLAPATASEGSTSGVSGRVTSEYGPASAIELTLMDEEGEHYWADVDVAGPDSLAYVAELPPGRYRLEVTDCLGGWADEYDDTDCNGPKVTRWWPSGLTLADGEWIIVEPNKVTSDVDMRIEALKSFTASPRPTISGDPIVGETLTAGEGVWEPSGATFAYQWYADEVSIDGANAATLTVPGSALGKKITVQLAATLAGYPQVRRTSDPTVAVTGTLAVEPGTSTIAGDPVVGQELSVNRGSWKPATTEFTYQWYRGDTEIGGATASSYLLVEADRGAQIRVKLTGSAAGYTAATATSAATGPVLGLLSGATPTITGTITFGRQLTASPGTWVPAPIGLAYQWLRNGQPIANATAATYTLSVGDVGAKIAVRVTGSKAGYQSLTRASAETSAVAKASLTSTPVPTITGTPTVDKVLTAVPGTWGPAPVTLAYQWYRGTTVVTGATAATYKVQAADVGQTLKVKVTGSKSGYNTVAKESTVTAAVAKASLTAAPVPTISDTTPTVDQALTATPGVWAPAPVTLAYQWYRGTTAIAGATKATYKVQSADLGQALKVKATGSKPGYTTVSKTSAATSVAAKATFKTAPVPTISGTARVDLTLTAVPGVWSPTASSFGYQWYRNGSAISGATAATYKLTAASLGTVITVRVTANRAGYVSVSNTSAGTVKVMAGLTAATPTISDTTPTVDQTLTARPGTWGPSPVTFTYQWYRGSTAITGATAVTYQAQAADVGQTLKVTVKGAKSGYASLSRTSAVTAAVVRASFATQPVPTISGTKSVGQTLTANPGTWSPKPDSLSYQWYRTGVAITGATKATYVLTATDKGSTMTVRVTARKVGYNTASKTSVPTAAIA